MHLVNKDLGLSSLVALPPDTVHWVDSTGAS